MDSYVPYEVRIEGEFSPGVWTSFGSDLVLKDGINWVRGNSSISPKDTIAVTGTLQFTLRNDDGCTGGGGYYSPNHPNCRSGFSYSTWVRVVYNALGVDTTRWTGKLRVINPTSGAYGEQVTRCTANDSMGDLAESDIREVDVYIDQPEDVLLDAMLDALPTESQPLARDLDAGLFTFPVAFDDLGPGTKGLSVAERVVTSARGRLFVKGDGTMRFMNMDNVSLQVPSYFFAPEDAQIDVPSDLNNVFNRVRLTGHPKTFTPAPIVLATHTGTLEVAPGTTQEVWLTYHDPDQPNNDIGGTDGIAPVATTDYTWNSAADGSGTNLTGSVTVTADFFISTVKLTITNGAIVPAFRTLLQVRGTGILDYDPNTVESYTARPYGNRPIDIDLPYLSDTIQLRDMAAFVESTYRDLADQISGIKFYPQRSATLMAEAMSLEIGDVVFASDPQSLPNGSYAFVQSVKMNVDADGILECYLDTAPWIVRPGAHADGVSVDDLLTWTIAAPESRADFAIADFSEAA